MFTRAKDYIRQQGDSRLVLASLMFHALMIVPPFLFWDGLRLFIAPYFLAVTAIESASNLVGSAESYGYFFVINTMVCSILSMLMWWIVYLAGA
jgi:hypothetical protein